MKVKTGILNLWKTPYLLTFSYGYAEQIGTTKPGEKVRKVSFDSEKRKYRSFLFKEKIGYKLHIGIYWRLCLMVNRYTIQLIITS